MNCLENILDYNSERLGRIGIRDRGTFVTLNILYNGLVALSGEVPIFSFQLE